VEVTTVLEAVTLVNTDPEFDAWKAAYEGRSAGPVSLRGGWFVPRDRQRQRAPRGARSAYTFFAERVAAPTAIIAAPARLTEPPSED